MATTMSSKCRYQWLVCSLLLTSANACVINTECTSKTNTSKNKRPKNLSNSFKRGSIWPRRASRISHQHLKRCKSSFLSTRIDRPRALENNAIRLLQLSRIQRLLWRPSSMTKTSISWQVLESTCLKRKSSACTWATGQSLI